MKTKCQRPKSYKISVRSNPGTLCNVWDSIINTEIYMGLHELQNFLYQLQYTLCSFRNFNILVNQSLGSLVIKHWWFFPVTKNSAINADFSSLLSACICQIHRISYNIYLMPLSNMLAECHSMKISVTSFLIYFEPS